MFWDYIVHVHDECGSVLDEECSIYAHRTLGLDWGKTSQCVTDSFSIPEQSEWTLGTTTNKLIDKDVAYWNAYGSSINPSIVINNATYRGQLESQAVMNAICAGFANPPEHCKKLLNDDFLAEDLEVGIVYYDDGYQHHHFIGIAIVSLICVTCILCFYRRSAKREMRKTMKI